ncbi:MAG: glycerol-3-phosphate 1-O-acyltransferase PlsY [Planctomycetota bacterium]|jgi:glycerol-3-phosphate acyltransferase PlsY
MIEPLVFLTAFAYLLGSVPFGLLIANAYGKDLRSIGSGNIGATNVARALGKRWAYVCFALDCLKGLVPMLVAKLLIGELTVAALSLWLAVGCAAVMGHVFPVYLKFKGGKGVATSLGMMLGLYPYYTIPGIVALVVWAGVVLIFRYVSLASMVASVVFPISLIVSIAVFDDWRFAQLWPLIVMALVMGGLIVVRHAENIKRLLEGSEAKVMQK